LVKTIMEINGLKAAIDEGEILSGLDLKIEPGEIHAIMGPNGAGKSTLAKVLAGHPSYKVSSGEALLSGDNILDLEPEERAHKGLFVGFQYPVEVPGVSNKKFLQMALNANRKGRGEPELSEEEFGSFLKEKMKLMAISEEFGRRNLNEGFSGGEKKRNEILQMLVLDPKVAVLDETDSGLDIDAMKVVSQGVNNWMSEERGLILITHYHRLLKYIQPTYVHVMLEGRIVKSGGPDLALELEEKGYDWLGVEAS
jgi:Fe-S cluster assembly ATP-binding protein